MFVAFILSTLRSHVRHRQNIRELMRLTDRELDDVGISRHEINAIASHGKAGQ